MLKKNKKVAVKLYTNHSDSEKGAPFERSNSEKNTRKRMYFGISQKPQNNFLQSQDLEEQLQN